MKRCSLARPTSGRVPRTSCSLALHRTRGRGLLCGFLSVAVGLKDALADVALGLVVASFAVREVGEDHVEPAVNFLHVAHDVRIWFVYSTFLPCRFTASLKHRAEPEGGLLL